MLLVKMDSSKYVSEFKERFSNFAQKAPILISFVTTDKGVSTIHENSGTVYDFDWDFTIPVKSFIHEIKQVLSDNHYPRILKQTRVIEKLTAEEQASMIAEGASVDHLPQTKEVVTSELFRIDKVIALKDYFVLQSEQDYATYMYKLNYSSIFFLKNYRSGKYKSIEEAGDFFFSKAVLVRALNGESN